MKRKTQFIESEFQQIEHEHYLNINIIRKKDFRFRWWYVDVFFQLLCVMKKK